MKIKELFSKSIERPINPAVVVSKLDVETIKVEIEEYVFTQDLMENLFCFLNSFLSEGQDKAGIWINGYYGSGKSHFIKYVYYCLNPETSDKAFDHFINKVREDGDPLSEVTQGALADLKRKVDSTEIDIIIFNIDAVSGQKNEKEKITKIFFNQFNGFRGYNSTNIQLALLLEKHLDKLGVFSDFKDKIKETFDNDWEADSITLTSLHLAKVLEIARSFDSTIDVDSLRAKLKNPDDITITDNLVPEFSKFLDEKPEEYRLIFMIDEVSQYIGSDTNLLLNLQTIIEELSSQCGNKIWVATTAQQTLDKVIQDTTNQGEDFGKILGRFETRISLQSQDADYITKKRILDKNSDAIEQLTHLYKENKDAITNQFIFSHDLYKGYESQNDFLESYPFIPYQFRLISDVFESFSQLAYVIKEVKDNERSVLAITHFTTKKNKERDTGYFIPFDAFFNELFERNLTHIARNVIDRAQSLGEIKNDTFALRVVRVLFMISNLTETKLMTFPPNLDNLTQILMDKVDINRLELQNRIQKVLDILIKESIINEENGSYQFYKEDEIDVANLIQSMPVTMDDRLVALHDDILEKILRIQRRISFGNNSFSVYLKVDGKEIYNKGDINVIITAFERKGIDAKALNVNRRDLIVSINEWFFDDDGLRSDFDHYVKTKKYIRKNFDSATGTRKKTIEKFGNQNTIKLNYLRKQVEVKFAETPFISAQQVIQPGEIKVQEPAKRFSAALEIHLKEIYKKNHLAQSKSNDELRKAAESPQLALDKQLTQGELLVDSHINQFGDTITVDDVIKHFLRPPYGWKDSATIGVLLGLTKKSKRKFEWRNDPIDPIEFVEKAIKTNERQAIVIRAIEEIGAGLTNNVRSAYRQIFNDDLTEKHEAGELYEEIKKRLNKKENDLVSYEDDYHGAYPFGIHFHEFRKVLSSMVEIRDPRKLFERLTGEQQNMKDVHDLCKDLADFIKHQMSNYKSIKKFTSDNRANFSSLEAAEQEKADTLLDYFDRDDKPGERFPQVKKIYEELKKGLNEHLNELKQNAVIAYKEIHKELDKQAQEFSVSDGHGLYDADTKIKTIEREKSITHLQLLLSEANKYKATKVQEIIAKKQEDDGNGGHIVKEAEVFKELSGVIKDENELEVYLANLKSKLLQKLKDNKIIIIQ